MVEVSRAYKHGKHERFRFKNLQVKSGAIGLLYNTNFVDGQA